MYIYIELDIDKELEQGQYSDDFKNKVKDFDSEDMKKIMIRNGIS